MKITPDDAGKIAVTRNGDDVRILKISPGFKRGDCCVIGVKEETYFEIKNTIDILESTVLDFESYISEVYYRLRDIKRNDSLFTWGLNGQYFTSTTSLYDIVEIRPRGYHTKAVTEEVVIEF